MASAINPVNAPIVNGKKTFIPLENNPVALAVLAKNLGVRGSLSFHDVYSLTDPDLLVFVPRPVLALIVTCAGDIYHAARESDPATASSTTPYDRSGPSEPVMWIKQTIGHACGSMALIHAMANGPARAHISPGSTLDGLLNEAVPLAPEPRAKLLYDSVALERAHMDAAGGGDSRPPAPQEPNDQHFIAFVKGKDGMLWELDGSWNGPIERGVLKDDEDALSERAVNMGAGKFIEAGKNAGIIEFSIVAVVEDDGET